MRFSDETLMAFADGELDEPTRRAVERAMRTDPALAAKVRQHIALRNDVFRAFARTLDEPEPARLKQVTQTAKVVQLDTVRAAKKHAVEVQRSWSWREWATIGAALVIGVLAGSVGMNSLSAESQLAASNGSKGALVARGALDRALTRQLVSARPLSAEIKIGISFVSRDGQYCRSFTTGVSAGLACRSGSEWRIPVMAEIGAAGESSFRQGGSPMPPAVMQAIDARAVGAALDAQGEQAAMQRRWVR